MEQFKKLNYNIFLTMIDVSTWNEIEKLKINEWKLTEKLITIYANIEHPYNLSLSKKYDSSNIIQITSSSFSKKTNDLKTLSIPIFFLNYNMEKDFDNMCFDTLLNSQKKHFFDKIETDSFDFLLYGVFHTYVNLKTHTFKYIIDYPTLDTNSPIFIKKKSSGKFVENLINIPFDQISINPLFVLDIENKKITKLTNDIVKKLHLFESDKLVICMLDLSSDKNIGWNWKNLLTLIRVINRNITEIKFLAIRDSWEKSIYFECVCDMMSDNDINNIRISSIYEKKIKTIDLSHNMDPVKIIESSSKLNLSLMKWRMSPNLKLDELANCKVLLLGSGTLGCNIARHLLMWGVNHITFVDRGTVSYSNPVRQSLFEFVDCCKNSQDRIKSIVAADAIKKILPSCYCEGVNLTIHMPGHRIDECNINQSIEDIKKLENLIINHDVTFLLTDTRESRWLPSLLASVHEKPVINVALGFDTFVVMRHGLKQQNKNRMGCYFCNDVVAPVDSLSGRTIDQQCTITRPGVSAIASAIAVEILASIYNHPEKFLCSHNDNNKPESDIGIIPQQIRGEINEYSNTIMYGSYYDKCVACSDIMVQNFKEEKYEFIIKCINESKYINKICEIKEQEDLFDDIIDMV